MTKQTEALRMAIAEIEGWIDHAYGHTPEECADNKTIQACKEALEQPTNMVTIPLDKLEDMQRKLKEQPTKEPVLYIDEGGLDGHATWAQATRCQATDIALYTHPKEWQ